MSKNKRTKSGGSAGAGGGAPRWEQGLLSAPFEEENWKASVNFVVGNKYDDLSHIQALTAAVSSGQRKLFSLITKDDLYAQVRDLGNTKGKKPAKELPQHYEVCEPCKQHLDTGENIPASLLARLLKFRLLEVKASDQKRREQEKRRCQSSPPKKKGGKEGKGKGDKAERGKSPKKGGKKTPDPPAAKEGSKLKKRGDEDLDKKYIDDEPDDGPQHYILVEGFPSPQLIPQLAEVGVFVDSVIKVSSQDYSRFLRSQSEGHDAVEKDEKTLAAEAEARNGRVVVKKELKKFWLEYLPVLQKQPKESKLHDVARLNYEVENLIIPSDLEDPEQKLTFGTTLFEDVACQIYDLMDAKRQYKSYLESMRLLHVPESGQPFPSAPESPVAPAAVVVSIPPPGQPEVDTRYYNDLMNIVPQESVSVPIIMHCMLEQIEATEDSRDPPSQVEAPPRTDGLNDALASHISDVVFKLALTEEEHNMLAEVFDLPERPPDTPKQPVLMNWADDLAARTHHLESRYGFNPEAVEKKMLELLPFSSLCELPRPTSRLAQERSSRLQELIHFCSTGGLTAPEIDRAFKQFVLESMDLCCTDPNGFLLTKEGEGVEHTHIPWDDPYPFFKGMLTKAEKALYFEETVTTAFDQTKDKDADRPATPISGESPVPSHSRSSSTDQLSGGEDPESGEKRQSRSRNKKKSKSGEKGEQVRLKSSSAEKKEKAVDPAEKKEDSESEKSRPESSDSQHHGILRNRSRSGSGKREHSRSNSVHFEKDEGGQPVMSTSDEEGCEDENEPGKSAAQSMSEIIDAQKRNLDQWCFAEHYEPHVLIQVLREAAYTLPFMDTYYHKRDHSLMVVLHNPHNPELQSHVDWHTELHCDLGFRNYLEYVSESVADWVAEQEAKYQAQLLSMELEKMRQDEASSVKAAEKGKHGSKSPKKSSSPPKSPKGSRASSAERAGSGEVNIYLRNTSIKAWQEEQDRIQQEAEEMEKQKADRKSGKSGKKSKDEDKQSRASKRPTSKGSAKSKGSKDETVIAEEALIDGEAEPFWPFTGYDVGNNLVHVSGITSSMFPTDGGQIRVQKTEFVQGTTSVESCVLKDGHVFTVHLLEPCEAGEEEEDEELRQAEREEELLRLEENRTADKDESMSEKTGVEVESRAGEGTVSSVLKESLEKPCISVFGSVFGQLNDGMCLAFSTYGPAGQAGHGKTEVEESAGSPPPTSPSPQPQADPKNSPGKGKKDKGAKDKPASPEPHPQEEEVKEEVKEEDPVPVQPFQQLYVTCPDGLNVKYSLESSVGVMPSSEDERKLLVRMSYPFKTKGEQPCESIRKKYALTEASRTVTTEGTVVKHLMDGTIEVLYSDGSVSRYTTSYSNIPLMSRSATPPPPDGEHVTITVDLGNLPKEDATESPRKSVKPSAKSMSTDKSGGEDEKSEKKPAAWVTTHPSGERTLTHDGTEPLNVKPVMVCLASDPETKQSMATRDDHVITISYPDGTTIVEHSDGTRITTYYRENQVPASNDDNVETGEMPQYELQQVKFIKVECLGYATIEFNCDTSENLTVFGNATTINVFPDGYYMVHHSDGGRFEVDPEGTATYYPRPNRHMEQIVPDREIQYVLRHNADVICETVDPDGNVFTVKHNGDCNVNPIETAESPSELSSIDSPMKTERRLMSFKQHAPRFFIIQGNGKGTELLRYQDVAEYLDKMEQDASTAMLQDPLPDVPGANCITVLRPYEGTPSDRWLKKYDMESIIPPGIRSRDLTTLPSSEVKTDGPKFGTNLGKGLVVGAAVKPTARFPVLKCPDTLELRQLVQYKPVGEALRDKLHEGLQEYAEYVKLRNQATNMLKVQDPRTEEEKIHAADLQTLALANQPKHLDKAGVKEVYETATVPSDPSPPPTPQPKRSKADWERDQRERREELEGREALRHRKIPPYFESELGKAFLLTQAKDMEDMMKGLSADHRLGMETERSETTTEERHTSQPHLYAQGSRMSNTDMSIGSPPIQSHTKMAELPVSPTGPGLTPSGLRPGNPTPAHATGQGSPAPLRPKNPTPSHGSRVVPDRPGNPTPTRSNVSGLADTPTEPRQSYRESSTAFYPSIKEQPEEEIDRMELPSADSELILTRSLAVDVTGQLRRDPIRIPASIQGGRPGASPNNTYRVVEDPVRRNIRNTVVMGATLKGRTQLNNLRGLNLLPEDVDYGILREGYTYAYTVSLKNTGLDSCRYKIRQPPPSTGLHVLYKPGPVAAGMKVDLCLELYAIAVGVEGETGVGTITHNLEIVTETDIMFLPIRATVLTAYEYDHRSPDSPRGGKSPATRLVSTRPPASTGIIRPRRDNYRDVISVQ